MEDICYKSPRINPASSRANEEVYYPLLSTPLLLVPKYGPLWTSGTGTNLQAFTRVHITHQAFTRVHITHHTPSFHQGTHHTSSFTRAHIMLSSGYTSHIQAFELQITHEALMNSFKAFSLFSGILVNLFYHTHT